MESVRLDKWLWAARCYKTRSLATEACSGGHVKVNGQSAKAAKSVRIGDRIEVTRDSWTRILVIEILSDKRGPAKVAQTLYQDLTPERPKEERLPAFEMRQGRPSKRDRRQIRRLKGR